MTLTINIDSLNGQIADISSIKTLNECEFSESYCRDWELPNAADCNFGRIPRCVPDCVILSAISSIFDSLNCCKMNGITCNGESRIVRMYAAGRPHTCSELLGRNITGAITDDIVDLDLLSALLIPDNQIHGALPVEIFELPNLVELDLSGNSITGELITPSSVTNLKEIILSNNSLTGSIPNFAFAHKAELIAIDDNYFVGTLELKFKENDQLRFLNLSGNDFEGKLPQLSPLIEVLDVSFNNKLSGENLWGTSVDFRAEGVPGIS